MLAINWEKNERIYSVIFHADVVGEHIWIQEDNTEDGFANLLLEKGVDKKKTSCWHTIPDTIGGSRNLR